MQSHVASTVENCPDSKAFFEPGTGIGGPIPPMRADRTAVRDGWLPHRSGGRKLRPRDSGQASTAALLLQEAKFEKIRSVARLAVCLDSCLSSREEMLSRFDELVKHVRESFEQEEKIMAACAYRGFREHRDDHRIVIGRLDHHRAMFAESERTCLGFIENAIEPFVVHHYTFDEAFLRF